MTDFRFVHPIEVRYADVDAQGHVNNAVYFTYFEQGRARYLQQVGLWDGRDFNALGIILAEASCTYRAPARYGQALQVGVRTVRVGTKSLEFAYTLQDAADGRVLAEGRSVQVAFDYRRGESIPVPDSWREAVRRFEGTPPTA